MTTSPTRSLRLAALASALALGVAACSASTATGPVPAATPASGSESGSVFADVDVLNVADGSTINLKAELEGGDLPVLLWFWAPH